MRKEGDIKIISIKDFILIIWDNRKQIIGYSIIGFIIGLIIAFSYPNEYTTTVKLLPIIEGSAQNPRAVNIFKRIKLNQKREGNDAIDIYVYPDVVNSIPFLARLIDSNVIRYENQDSISLRRYFQKYNSIVWWKKIPSLPSKIKSLFKSSQKSKGTIQPIDEFRLTEGEFGLLNGLGGRIKLSISDQTNMITIKVTMQDPLIAAIIADSVINQLENYILAYKRRKIEDKLTILERIRDEAKLVYYSNQDKLARYEDSHYGIWANSKRIKRDSLINVVTQHYNFYLNSIIAYNSLLMKLNQFNKAFYVVEPSRVNDNRSSPNRVRIIFIFTIIGFSISTLWNVSLRKTLLPKREN